MLKFKVLSTGEIKTGCSFREKEEKIFIKFSSEGKEYGYNKNNIEIINCENINLPFLVYAYTKKCYKCNSPTEILTYITYDDKYMEDVKFPYDFDKLLKNQNLIEHLMDPSIEYYGINVIGDIEKFDNMLMEKYPDKIKNVYSKTKDKLYPMNVCCHCGSGQGWFFIYKDINEMIQKKFEIKLYK
jgi:hypothetical protein